MTTADPYLDLVPPSLLDGQYAERLPRNRGAYVLWGYEPDPENPAYIVAVPEQLELLRQALDFLRQGHSYRKVARWLHARSGRHFDHAALRERWHREQELQRRRRQLTADLPLDDAPKLMPVAAAPMDVAASA